VKEQLFPQNLDHAIIEKMLRSVRHLRTTGERLKALSSQLLGYPYITHPLTGSADSPEVFTVSLEGFDCVTYIETALALAMAASVSEFVEIIRHLRYKNGRIEWRRRNHYMTGWIKNNARRGFVRNITRGKYTIGKTRTLGLLKDLPSKTVTFKCFPKKNFSRIANHLADGDLIFFVSTRRKLDVFHAGLLFREGEQIILRHASRSQGGVAEQPLEEFLQKNRMAGFILVRPREKPLAVKG
jgi:hypothetical protein